MVPKTGPHSGSQKVRFCCYLLYVSKVRGLGKSSFFGDHFGDHLGDNIVDIGIQMSSKKSSENRHPNLVIVGSILV